MNLASKQRVVGSSPTGGAPSRCSCPPSCGGQDLGPTGGFATLALNAGWRPNKTTLLTAGVDNVFDRTYREHLGKGGWDFGSAKVTDLRINEPGRTFWLKAQVALD